MKKSLWQNIYAKRYFYVLLLPLVLYYIIFSYIPIYGITLAFKEFNYAKGIIGSKWIGFQNFTDLFIYEDFWTAFYNTIIISLGRLIIEFPVPIILALLLNEITRNKIKRLYQTVITFPHFLSWVVLSGIIINTLNDSGVVNQMISAFGFAKFNFLMNTSIFRPLLYVTDIWKEMGWSAIIYIAAISGINPELYEASYVDGANRFQQMKAVTWPGIKSTAVVLLILAVGGSMNAGFDQVYNLYNPAVYEVGDIIDTFIYRRTFTGGASFGSSTAVGLFKSVIAFALLYSANLIAKKAGEEGIV